MSELHAILTYKLFTSVVIGEGYDGISEAITDN